ncbi:MAG: NAD(P)-binding domain-containing protein [Acidobacteria bacterium]|nr:NAD(P)-binding domain-containing protein [Acidobacteriota bacterium]
MHRVGVLGSAVVWQTLARGFQTHGHDVCIGSRTPAKLADFSSTTGIHAATFTEAASWAEIVVLAVHGSTAEEALRLAGADHLAGKIVIDTTNPISDAPPVDGVLQFFTGPNSSLLERLQAAYPHVRTAIRPRTRILYSL